MKILLLAVLFITIYVPQIESGECNGTIYEEEGVNATTTTTPEPTTTYPYDYPIQCINATNFTESWRTWHNISYKPNGPSSKDYYACDFRQTLQWFRFTGKAGNVRLS